MFKKPFRIKSQSSMKGSDRKKLRVEIQKSFPFLDTDACMKVIPSKEEVTNTKIYTHTGDNAYIYSVNKLPLLFELDKQKTLYPTVYLLWQYPDLVTRFTTWPPVFQKMTEGADLMLPGVILRETLTPSTFKHVSKGQVCSVNVVGNRCPIAVGQTLLSGSDFFDSGMKGKGVHPVHLVGDELWAFGDKSYPPTVEDDSVPSEADTLEDSKPAPSGQTHSSETTTQEENTQSHNDIGGMETGPPRKGSFVEGQNNTEDVCYDVESKGADLEDRKSDLDLCACGSEDDLTMEKCSLQERVSQEPEDEEVVESRVTLSPEEMDELLQFCFLCAIKSSLKKSDLPIPTGTFYKLHVMKYCQKEKNLDIKKSSYKKLSKFLQKQEKTGIIKLKELSKGVDSIVEIDKSHELLRGLDVPEVIIEEIEDSSESAYTPPQITEMFSVTANTLPLFKQLGYSKGSSLKPADIRDIVTEYVKTNNLQKDDSRSDVTLDPVLAEILLVKAEGDRSSLKWDEVFLRLLNKMSAVHEVVFPGQPAVIRKGSPEPIKIDVVQRASNKKATIVENLDLFGIDAKSFAQTVQVKMACSASVNPSQQKNKGPQVVIQGNQIHFLAELLTNTYKIAKKYINGLEKARKSKRR